MASGSRGGSFVCASALFARSVCAPGTEDSVQSGCLPDLIKALRRVMTSVQNGNIQKKQQKREISWLKPLVQEEGEWMEWKWGSFPFDLQGQGHNEGSYFFFLSYLSFFFFKCCCQAFQKSLPLQVEWQTRGLGWFLSLSLALVCSGGEQLLPHRYSSED